MDEGEGGKGEEDGGDKGGDVGEAEVHGGGKQPLARCTHSPFRAKSLPASSTAPGLPPAGPPVSVSPRRSSPRPPPTHPPPAVANSGGPDSTCLLFLIQRFLADSPSAFGISSITVDHALQPSSPAMAQRAAATAASLRVPHTTSRIPWGTHPFPPLPDPSRPFESIARTARYHFFWKHMQKDDAGALVLGHHCDDQVETALMRLGRKSSELGGRGMLACRRWGMGQANDLEWVGYDGMSKWIVRPLLEVSKARTRFNLPRSLAHTLITLGPHPRHLRRERTDLCH